MRRSFLFMMMLVSAIALVCPVAFAQMDQPVEAAPEPAAPAGTNDAAQAADVLSQLDEKKVRTAAIFVKNRAKNVPDEKVAVLEDFITSRITDGGFHVIAREDVINAVASFANAGPNQGDASFAGQELDKILSNNTSALALTRNMGADYFLVASITTLGADHIRFNNEQGVNTDILEHKLTVSYKLVDAAMGGSLTGDVIEVSEKIRQQPGLTIERDVVNNLLNDSSGKLAAGLIARAEKNQIREGPARKGMVEFTIHCGMQDLSIPEIVKNDAGEYVVTANQYRVEAMAVTVAIDGVTVGTTPGPLQAYPGLAKIRLSREGFKDWSQTINIRKDMTLVVPMQMTEDGHARWKENTAFLEGLKASAKLSDAQAKMWEGLAKMLEQSGLRIDQRSNTEIKSDRPADVIIPGNQQHIYHHDGDKKN